MFRLFDPKTRLDIIEKVRFNGRKVLRIGVGLSLFSAISPWLLVLDIIPSNFFTGIFIYISMVLGMGLTFVGLIYNNYIDMSE